MEVTNATILGLQRAIVTAWQAGLEWKPPVDLSFLYRDFPSSTRSNQYPWADFVGKFREWIGDRVFNTLSAQVFEIVNRDFERSLQERRNIINDDQYSVFVSTREQDAAAWNQLLNDIVVEVLTANTTCFTGKGLLANDHAYGDNTIDNLTDQALSESAFNAALIAVADWKFANGIYIRPRMTHLLFGPKLRETAFHIVTAKQHASGGIQVDNPNVNKCIPVEIPDLVGAYDDYWMLVDASTPLKLIARQIREVPVPKTNDLADIEESGMIKFMASGRCAAGPTMPHLVYGGRL